MSIAKKSRTPKLRQWVVVRNSPEGSSTAEVVGVPELQATGATRDQAIESLRALINEWITSGQLVAIDVPRPNPLLNFTGHTDPNDPIEREFLDELARAKRQDLEQTLKEYEQECQNSSSTPTI